MQLAMDREAAKDAIRSFLGAWVRKREPHCDWCGLVFEKPADLDQYAEFCVDLNKLWPSTFKQQPPAKVFCAFCALGAIEELITGKRYDASASVPF